MATPEIQYLGENCNSNVFFMFRHDMLTKIGKIHDRKNLFRIQGDIVAFNECLYSSISQCKYVANIDIDEVRRKKECFFTANIVVIKWNIFQLLLFCLRHQRSWKIIKKKMALNTVVALL